MKELDADTVANMEEFDPDKKVVNISGEVTDDTIITTWMCVDGYGKDADVCKIDLGGYSAYMCQNHLYLINAGFKEEHLNALMKRILEEPDFNIKYIRFLYKGIIIKHNKTEPTYTKTSLFLCEKRRFFMGRTEKGGKVF